MSLTEKDRRKTPRKESTGKKKKNALVVFDNGKEFWTTQNQFWQWVREKVIVKAGDNPLRGNYISSKEK